MHLKERIALYCISKAVENVNKKDFDHIMKGLKWLERSLLFATKEERQYVAWNLKQAVINYDIIPKELIE